jgi:hypothetical protein
MYTNANVVKRFGITGSTIFSSQQNDTVYNISISTMQPVDITRFKVSLRYQAFLNSGSLTPSERDKYSPLPDIKLSTSETNSWSEDMSIVNKEYYFNLSKVTSITVNHMHTASLLYSSRTYPFITQIITVQITELLVCDNIAEKTFLLNNSDSATVFMPGKTSPAMCNINIFRADMPLKYNKMSIFLNSTHLSRFAIKRVGNANVGAIVVTLSEHVKSWNFTYMYTWHNASIIEWDMTGFVTLIMECHYLTNTINTGNQSYIALLFISKTNIQQAYGNLVSTTLFDASAGIDDQNGHSFQPAR